MKCIVHCAFQKHFSEFFLFWKNINYAIHKYLIQQFLENKIKFIIVPPLYGVAEGQTRLSDFTFTFHFHALEKEMATHSSVLAWKIPGTGEPGGLPSMGSHRVGHDWSDSAAAATTLHTGPSNLNIQENQMHQTGACLLILKIDIY